MGDTRSNRPTSRQKRSRSLREAGERAASAMLGEQPSPNERKAPEPHEQETVYVETERLIAVWFRVYKRCDPHWFG